MIPEKNTTLINSLVREHQINMPQMANNGLSENWLFKELGDMHWALLGHGLKKKSSEVVDTLGSRLYSTFVRINIEVAPLYSFSENEKMNINAEIKRFGQSTYLSEISGKCGKKKIKAKLLTVFSKRGEEGNSRLFRSHAHTKENSIPEYEDMPGFLNEYKLLKKRMIESINIGKSKLIVSDNVIHETTYTINPYYELNGIGLLYCASYPIISDKCEADYFNSINNERWEKYYHTTIRDVFYFANCNRNDRIIYRLNTFEHLKNNSVRISSSLYRESDMVLMAKIFTIKKKSA